jgi:cytochrome P450 family 135
MTARNGTGIPPGPKAPRAVQTLAWITRPGPFMLRARERFGDTFTVKIAQEGTWVFLTDPADVRAVFTGDPKVLHAGEANVVLKPFLGARSVLLLDDDPHLAARKLLLPPFHGERMRKYGELISSIAEREIASWPRGEPIALWPRMQAITLEVIVRAIFGVEDHAAVERLRGALQDVLEFSTRPTSFAAMAALGPERIEKLKVFQKHLRPADEAVYAEIRARRNAGDLEERDDILSLLLQARHEDGSPMADEELRDELMTLLVAGHETTATSLAWALERLLRHPDAWERLKVEAAAGGEDYTDAVIKETLRLRPVIPLVVRRLQEPFEVAGRTLPAGVTVAPCIWLVHRRPDVYPDPHAFRPERFLDEPAGTYTWLPFGGGIRRCLGAAFAQFEMKQVLRALALHAPLAPVRPEGERVARRAITLTPKHGAEAVLA